MLYDEQRMALIKERLENLCKESLTISGAMFQGVMDKNQRRELVAHYTSEENILKLINPLFKRACLQHIP